MNISNINDAKEWFEVLQTVGHCQIAIMNLPPGKQSAPKKEMHEKSDQVLLLLKGELVAQVGKEKRKLRKGDTCIVPAGTPHRFRNLGKRCALSFNVYSPPNYASA